MRLSFILPCLLIYNKTLVVVTIVRYPRRKCEYLVASRQLSEHCYNDVLSSFTITAVMIEEIRCNHGDSICAPVHACSSLVCFAAIWQRFAIIADRIDYNAARVNDNGNDPGTRTLIENYFFVLIVVKSIDWYWIFLLTLFPIIH